MMRGLLLVEMMRPKSPGLVMRPFESMLPPDEAKALKLLIGLAKFTWLKRLKNSARHSMFFDSEMRKRLMTEKSTLVSTISIGRPDIAVKIPDNSQLVNNRRLEVERLAKAGFGNSQR